MGFEDVCYGMEPSKLRMYSVCGKQVHTEVAVFVLHNTGGLSDRTAGPGSNHVHGERVLFIDCVENSTVLLGVRGCHDRSSIMFILRPNQSQSECVDHTPSFCTGKGP